MPLTGSLEEFPLVPLIGLFEASRSTGVLQIREDSERAALGFDEGALVSASYGTDQGEIALAAAAALASGSFQWSAGEAPASDLKGTTAELLAKTAKLRDAIADARKAIPDERARFTLAGAEAADKTVAVKPHHWKVLSAIDGRRDVAAIARETGSGRLLTLRSLSELLGQGLIHMTEAPPRVARPRRTKPKPEATPETAGIAAVEPTEADAADEPPAEPPEPAKVMPFAVVAPEATPEPAAAMAPTPAAPLEEEPVSADEAPTIVGADLAAELDARLAAISMLGSPPSAPAAPAAASSQVAASPAAAPVIAAPTARPVETPALPAAFAEESPEELTQVIVSHYLPPSVERPAAPLPKPEPAKRGGILGFFFGSTVQAADEPMTLPSAAQLAKLANALLINAAQTPGSQPSQSAEAHLQQIYQTRPIGHRIPTHPLAGGAALLGARVPDLVDEEAIAKDPAADRLLPVLAALIQQIRDVEGRAMGTARATKLYRESVAEVFGEPRHKSATTMVIRNVATPSAHARVTVRMGGPHGPYELKGRECTIGRSAGNYIVLEDSSVSGQHARLIPRADGFTIVDLGSRNGTTVDGEKIKGPHLLKGGEVIGIGEAVLDFELLGT